MKHVKIVTIGGGSSYTPELMEGFIKRYEQMPIREMWLVDVEEGKEKLEIIASMARRMWRKSGYDVMIYTTFNRKDALKDADFVTTQFRVGQLDARILDERIPLSYGMAGQETNGAGGIFKAFRTIPVMLDLVEEMKVLCPNAWLINFTNPSGMITEAVIRYGHWDRVIGLCNAPIGSMLEEPKLLGKTKDELIFRFAGLNHFHWHKVYDCKGQDMTSTLIKKMAESNAGIPANIKKEQIIEEQLLSMNMIPNAYHQYYYMEEESLTHLLEEYRLGRTRAEQVKQSEAELFELYQDTALDVKPKQLAMRGGAHYSDAACETIVSIYGNKNTEMVVSTMNRGSIVDLPYDCVVEVTALIGGMGATPLIFGSFPPAQKGWLQLMKNMELVICEAAVKGDYGLALEAFSMNPLIRSGRKAKAMLDELLLAHERYLPQFKGVIDLLKKCDPVD